jgi:hypothetical protein
MPSSTHDTPSLSLLQADSFGKPQWEQEVVPRLPSGWQAQAKACQAFVRVRELRSASDLLRGVLAYVLCVHSFRHLGIWGVLIDLADISEAAWRKRLAKARAWLGWLLVEVLAIGVCTTPWLLAKGLRRVLLVDGTHLPALPGEGWTGLSPAHGFRPAGRPLERGAGHHQPRR